jgi:transcriptional regulator with XRE-family HTH domain
MRMYARSLFRLMALIGLSQAAVARELGVTRQLVWKWANGVAPIPDERFEALKPVILRAVTEALAPPLRLRLGARQWQERQLKLVQQILQCVEDWQVERSPDGPMALVHSASVALQKYAALDEATREELLQKAEHRRQYAAALSQALDSLGVLDRLVPLRDDIMTQIEGQRHADDGKA